MLKIKLARFGKKNQPHYRIVVAEARSKRDSGYVANLGHYAPTQTPKLLSVNMELYKTWLQKGAQPTETVSGLVRRFESGNPFPVKAAGLSRKAKAKQAEAAAQEAEKAAAPKEETAPAVEETPAEVVTTEATPAEETATPEEAPAEPAA